MGIILRESRLIHTKQQHAKLLGSSKYIFDRTKDYPIRLKRPVEKKKPIDQIQYELDTIEALLSVNSNLTINEAAEMAEWACTPEKRAKKTEYSLNKQKVREKCAAFFGLKKSRKFMAFYTISFPVGFSDDLCMQVFNTWLTRSRKLGLSSYLWVAERQCNGTLHFHLLTNNFLNVRRVNRFMAKAIETQINKHNIETAGIEYINNKGEKRISEQFTVAGYNGVDVKPVNNNRKRLNQYLTKYISKNDIVFFRLPYHSSRDISELFTAESFRSFRDSDFRYILKQLQHVTTFVIDNEYASIEFLNTKQPNGKYFNPPDDWYWFMHFWNEQVYDIHNKKQYDLIGYEEKGNYIPKWKKPFTKELLNHIIN